MDFAELKSRYLEWPMAGRLALCLVVGCLPPAAIYVLEYEDAAMRLDTARLNETQARSQFDTAKRAQADLGRLQAQLASMEEQLDRVKRYLPDTLAFDEVLHTTAEIAREQAIEMTLFEPKDERQPEGKLKFVEQPVEIRVRGGYGDIAVFFDRLLHLERVTNFRNLKLTNNSPMGQRDPVLGGGANNQNQDGAVTIEASGTMIVFRGLKPGETFGTAANPAVNPAANAPTGERAGG